MFLATSKSKGIVIFDPNCQYKIGQSFEHVDDLMNAIAENPNGIFVYRPMGKNVEEDFDAFSEQLWKRGNFTVIIDEAHNLQKANYLNPWLNKWTRQAPTEADAPFTVHIIQTMHRPSDSNGLCRSQATDFYFFRTTLPRDLEVVEDQCGIEVAEMLPNLPQHHFVHYNVDTEETHLVDTPDVWLIDLRPKKTEMETVNA